MISTHQEARRVYDELGVTPVINACGIYTDLGGSRLSETVWQGVEEANATWASMPELLDRAGAAVAGLLDVEAVRVVPGASAGLALAVGACMAGHDGRRMEQLPSTKGIERTALVMQHAHRYKYTRCALMSGATVREVGTDQETTEETFSAALGPDVACVLHPAHLDERPGALNLETVVRLAHAQNVPVVVDAAYMSYPVSLMGTYGDAGADLTCFSAKYFWGPNAGGFIYGRADLIRAVAELDFTGYESGEHLIFGRAFKLDRATIVATVLALREWLEMDHELRWEEYRQRANDIIAALQDLPASVRPGSFTLDERIVPEPVNAVLIELDPNSGFTAAGLEASLRAGSPSVRVVDEGNTLVVCLETVGPDEQEVLVNRILSAFNA